MLTGFALSNHYKAQVLISAFRLIYPTVTRQDRFMLGLSPRWYEFVCCGVFSCNYLQVVFISFMKKFFIILGAVSILACGVSCESLNTGASLPIPFTNPSASVSLDIQATPLPPKFCIGLDITETP